MKENKFLLLFFLLFLIILPIFSIEAKSGCCSWHRGVAYCDTSAGRYVCNDGTYSPSCGCAYIPPATPNYIPSKDDLIKKEVEKSKSDYYKNPHWFREKLITKIINSLKADISSTAFYVYTMLPDIK